jgi:hypothetical protein
MATMPANAASMACAMRARRPVKSCAQPMARKPPMPMRGVGMPSGYANTVRFTAPQPPSAPQKTGAGRT